MERELRVTPRMAEPGGEQAILEAVLKLVRWLSKAVEFRHRRPWKAIVPVKTQF